MATAASPVDRSLNIPLDDSRDLYDLFRIDQTKVVSLFFLIVAGMLLVLLVPQINETPDVVRHQDVNMPTLPAYLLDFAESDWTFHTAYDTTISTLTLGLELPSPPPTINMWRWWANDWAWQMLNPVALRVPTVSFALITLMVYLSVGLFGLMPRYRPHERWLLPTYVIIIILLIVVPALIMGWIHGLLLPIAFVMAATLGGYLIAIYSGYVTPEHMEDAQQVGLLTAGVLLIPLVIVLAAAGKTTSIVTLMASSARLATPIVIGAMAGIWSERSGVVNIAIEGMMLTGAAFGFIAYTLIDQANPDAGGIWIGILVAALSGGVMALLHAWLSITFKTDQIISGTVINILALGLTSFMRGEVLLSADAARRTLPSFTIPGLGDLPIIGEILFTGKPVFFSMFLLIALTHIMLFFTRWGLRTRAVGENPHAADTLGINVARNRYSNVVVGGFIAGLGGAWFSLETAGTFDEGMTNGLGFIALAAVIFGKWRPIPAAIGGLLFGFSRALDTRFQILEVGVPVQFVQMTPYLVTMVVLAGLVGRAIAPKAIGQPYEKE